MTDNVKDSLQVDQVARDLAVPGTPNSNSSQDNGGGLGEDLKDIDEKQSSGRASSEGQKKKKKVSMQSGTSFSMNSDKEEEEESEEEEKEEDSEYTSEDTAIREKTAEALKRIQKEHEFKKCCSLCDCDQCFPMQVSCQTCGEFPATHHSTCCKVNKTPKSGTNRWRNMRADRIDELWKETEKNRQNKEIEERAKQRQEEYEERLMKMFSQKTAELKQEQKVIKDENDSLRNMIRSKCAQNSALLVDGSLSGTPHDMLLDLGLKAAKDSILVHARTLYPFDPAKAAELVAEAVQKVTLQMAGQQPGNTQRQPLPPKQETYAFYLQKHAADFPRFPAQEIRTNPTKWESYWESVEQFKKITGCTETVLA
jgi:hypothetical protein